MVLVGSYRETSSQKLSGTSLLLLIAKAYHLQVFSIGDCADLDMLRE